MARQRKIDFRLDRCTTHNGVVGGMFKWVPSRHNYERGRLERYAWRFGRLASSFFDLAKTLFHSHAQATRRQEGSRTTGGFQVLVDEENPEKPVLPSATSGSRMYLKEMLRRHDFPRQD